MLFASAITDEKNPSKAGEALLSEVSGKLKGLPCHLAFLFVSALYGTDWKPILAKVREALGNPMLLGCTGGGILGGTQELEGTPAMALVAGHLPEVQCHPFTVSPRELEENHPADFWWKKCGVSPEEKPVGILLADPFSCDVMRLTEELNAGFPQSPFIGGLASGADFSGGCALFLNTDPIEEAAAGIFLTGDVALETIVAQGTRPIGRTFIVTQAQGNLILELAGIPALDALQKLFLGLTEKERALARRALLIGVVINEQRQAFARGDFLIRNLIGIDEPSRALAVGSDIRVGQTVQFQVRDAESSREDLEQRLKEFLQAAPPLGGAGALLFCCTGRGADLYGEKNVDTRMIQQALGPLALAGFFCNGEIGPVGGKNFVHGFTASLGLFLKPPGRSTETGPLR